MQPQEDGSMLLSNSSGLVSEAFSFAYGLGSHWAAFMTGGIPAAAFLFLERYRKKQFEWRTFFVIFVVVGFVVASFEAWREERDALVKKDTELAAAVGERDEARRQGGASPMQQSTINRLSSDLANARGQIDEQQKQLKTAEKRIEAQDKEIAALKSPKPARHIRDETKAKIIHNFTPLADQFSDLQISAPAGDGNAHSYAREYMDIFNQIKGIHIERIGMLFATSATPPGPDIFILVKDLSHVPDKAELFAKTLVASGIQVQGGTLDTLADDKFVMMIGPAP